MGEALGHGLLMVALGFVTGAFGATVLFALLIRRHRDPEFQGRRVNLYLGVCVAVFVGMVAWLTVWPWL